MSEFELRPPAPTRTVRTWRASQLVWPAVGLLAVAFSLWLLVRELRGLSLAEIGVAFEAISGRAAGCWPSSRRWSPIFALAWYDRIALAHLGFSLPWTFISRRCRSRTYALSHNVGMSMFSGAMVRYRAYSTRGLTIADIGVLVAFCSFTFALGTGVLGGIVFLIHPEIMARLFHLPVLTIRLCGLGFLALALLYAAGSALHLKPVSIGSFKLVYPRPNIMVRQLVAGPLELIGAAGIIWCALPAADNPGFLIVMGVFLASFSAALLSHAPGGLGVLELVFVTALPDVPKANVLAALLVFRLLYLIAPLILGIIAVVLFERSRLARLGQRDE